MRRLVSIALMVVLGLPLFASVLGRAQEARLPACCRRAGAHHCMEMAEAGVQPSQPSVRMTCPAFPRSTGTMQSGGWTFDAAGAASAEMVNRPEVVGQVEAGYRVSLGRAWQKRGPPLQNS